MVYMLFLNKPENVIKKCNYTEKGVRSALKKCRGKIKDQFETEEKQLKKRRMNIMWFMPPYNRSVKTNVCKYFLHKLQRQFPPNQNFGGIFPVKVNVHLIPHCTHFK